MLKSTEFDPYKTDTTSENNVINKEGVPLSTVWQNSSEAPSTRTTASHRNKRDSIKANEV